MTDTTIDIVADAAATANEQFNAAHPDAETLVGTRSQTVRKMGIAADAVTIDCQQSGKRLSLVVMDQAPDTVGIGIGQAETIGQYELIRHLPVKDLTSGDILEVLEARF